MASHPYILETLVTRAEQTHLAPLLPQLQDRFDGSVAEASFTTEQQLTSARDAIALLRSPRTEVAP